MYKFSLVSVFCSRRFSVKRLTFEIYKETMHFHIAHTKDTFVSHSEYPNKQFGTQEKLSWGCQVT